jgi:hypothetical protein
MFPEKRVLRPSVFSRGRFDVRQHQVSNPITTTATFDPPPTSNRHHYSARHPSAINIRPHLFTPKSIAHSPHPRWSPRPPALCALCAILQCLHRRLRNCLAAACFPCLRQPFCARACSESLLAGAVAITLNDHSQRTTAYIHQPPRLSMCGHVPASWLITISPPTSSFNHSIT